MKQQTISLLFLIGLISATRVTPATAQQGPGEPRVCEIADSKLHTGSDRVYDYRPFNHALVQKQFRLAMRLYTLMFRCPASNLFQGLNPLVEDGNQLEPFDHALAFVMAGDYNKAIDELKGTVSIIPAFAEARNLLGICQLLDGRRNVARETWHQTLTVPYFAQPPDSSGEVEPIAEARYLLSVFR